MIRILLIRHGSTDLLGRVLYGRTPGILLNSEGLREANQVAEGLRSQRRLDAVISSPLERAMQTAAALAQAHECNVTVDDNLTEVDFGSWCGRPFEELRENNDWKKFNQQRSISSAPGGESMMEVQTRAWKSVERIASTFKSDATVAVVTHGDVIRCLLILLLGMSLDHIHRLEISPSSVSEILIGNYQPIVKNVNRILY